MWVFYTAFQSCCLLNNIIALLLYTTYIWYTPFSDQWYISWVLHSSGCRKHSEERLFNRTIVDNCWNTVTFYACSRHQRKALAVFVLIGGWYSCLTSNLLQIGAVTRIQGSVAADHWGPICNQNSESASCYPKREEGDEVVNQLSH